MRRHQRSAHALSSIVLLSGIFLLFLTRADAAVDFVSTDPITHGISTPTDVAVAPNGLILVVDGSQNQVLAFNRAGVEQFRIPVDKPNTVAAGSDSIYVGSNADLSVRIFNLDGQKAYPETLDDSTDRFKMTINIAVDPITDNVYVVDLLARKIKIFSPAGEYLGNIEDPGAEPQDIAFTGNEIFLLDQASTGANLGSGIRSTRIVIFDRAGKILRSFAPQGASTGQIYSAKGIAADSTHFYVSDAFHGVVLAFTHAGVSDGALQDTAVPMKTPMGLAMAPEGNKLFVASPATKSVKVFVNSKYVAPEPPPTPTPAPSPTPAATPTPNPEPTPAITETTPVPRTTPRPRVRSRDRGTREEPLPRTR